MTIANPPNSSSRLLSAAFTSEDHRNLLDIIDDLRSQGLSRYVDLPEIIVCGDQSAGKSSVLEAISGLRFPTKDGLCTRFATELILRRGEESRTKVSITPTNDRDGDEKADLESWQPIANIDKDELDAVTEEALGAMGASGSQRFYNDILRIECTGPRQPHLTMVDLPGLFRTGNKEQSDADVDMVSEMVTRYMARPRSIILAVVSAKNEYVLQGITSMARKADPDGLRTMGLITKPDTLDVGSDSERGWVEIAQNKGVELRLDWHVLRNRNFEQRDSTSAERDTIEQKFFRTGIWTAVDPLHCGVAALRVRLSTLLKNQILSQLPSLVQDVEANILQCNLDLHVLGPLRENHEEQRRYLLGLGRDYTSLMEQAINGTYTKEFFGNLKKPDSRGKRLRAQVQNRLQEFADEMRLNGQSQLIIDSDDEKEEDSLDSLSPRVSRSDYLEDVTIRLRRMRGRELPGLFNPLIVGELFTEQCEPWRGLVQILVDDVLGAVRMTTRLVIEHIAAKDVFHELLNFVHGQVDELEAQLNNKVQELLTSATYRSITYNRQLTENVRKTQQARYKRAIKQQIVQIFGLSEFENTQKKFNINPVQIVDRLADGRENDMEMFGSSLAVDYMEAYYKVAINRFIDDISVLAIEDCLVDKVARLLDSVEIDEMEPGEVSRLAGESANSTTERKQLEDKRGILEQALRSLKGMMQPGELPNELERISRSADHKHRKAVDRTAESVNAVSPVYPLSPPPPDQMARVHQDHSPVTYRPQSQWYEVEPESTEELEPVVDYSWKGLNETDSKKKKKKKYDVGAMVINDPVGNVDGVTF